VILRLPAVLEISLPSLVEFTTVHQEVSPLQERVHLVTDDLEEIHKFAVKIIVDFYPASRLIQ
jgi:hypothetical protein